MATRTIVTSQPDVACEVCDRRLLRGEQPDIFLAAGRRRIVCELCAPRAAHEGWMRETDGQSLTLPPMRARRGRSLFERLRQVGRPAGDARDPASALDAGADGSAEQAASYDLFGRGADATASAANGLPARSSRSTRLPADLATAAPSQPRSEPFDFVAGDAVEQTEALGAEFNEIPPDATTQAELGSETAYALEESSPYLEQAIAVFNASEFPRRVAGVTRSLGAPSVNVRSAEHLSSVVSIVVAWELCWYRYEVDLSEPVVEAQVIGQGTELTELAREDRLANAAAGESGMLVFAGV